MPLSHKIHLDTRHESQPLPTISFEYLHLLSPWPSISSQAQTPMYHHANTNINPSPPSDHASNSTKSSESRRRQIPLAFANTGWGREYIANPNWEQENLGKSNASIRQGSRVQPDADGKTIRESTTSHAAPTIRDADASTDSHSSPVSASAPPSTPPTPPQSSQQYSVMVSWNFFRRTFAQSSPTSDTPDTEKRRSTHPEQDELVELGPWVEILMRWDDFEHWRLRMLQRAWYLPVST